MIPDDYLRAIETELACIPMDSAYRTILLDLIDQYGESMYCIGHEDGLDRGQELYE